MFTNKTNIVRFNDLHIIGEFDYRPGTGRFKKEISCVVISFGRRQASVYNNIGRCPADLLSDFWKFLALVRHRTMPTRTVAVGIVRLKF